MAHGGKRVGAGRKPRLEGKRRIEDYFTEEEVETFIKDIKAGMMGDPVLAKFMLEQLFGKAPQRVEMTGKDGEALVITWQNQ